MKKIWLAAVVVLFAAVAGCSSSSSSSGGGGGDGGGGGGGGGSTLGGSAKIKSCKNDSLSKSSADACDTCDANKCADQGATFLGTDPNAFGGACGDYLSCTCDCSSTDTTCLQACAPKQTQACKDALNGALSCQQTNCASDCASDGG